MWKFYSKLQYNGDNNNTSRFIFFLKITLLWLSIKSIFSFFFLKSPCYDGKKYYIFLICTLPWWSKNHKILVILIKIRKLWWSKKSLFSMSFLKSPYYDGQKKFKFHNMLKIISNLQYNGEPWDQIIFPKNHTTFVINNINFFFIFLNTILLWWQKMLHISQSHNILMIKK